MSSLYLMSGIVMLLGAYLTMRYTPYCVLQGIKRQRAMSLHRKKLLDMEMSPQEKEELGLYLKEILKFSIGSFLIFVGGIVHIGIYIGVFEFKLSPFYYLSVVLILPNIVISGGQHPYCYAPFPAIILWNFKNDYLEALNTCDKQFWGKELNSDEMYIIRMEKVNSFLFYVHKYAPFFGVCLFTILDIWYAIGGSLIFN